MLKIGQSAGNQEIFGILRDYTWNNSTQQFSKMNNKFLDWFVGFSEGDGSFIVPSTGSNRFEIWQSAKDAQVLYHIKTNLGFGKVVFPAYRPDMAIFLITKSEHLECLRLIFAHRMCTINTFTRYHAFFNIDLSTSTLKLHEPTLLNYWLAGFIDAEGCFRIKIESNNTIKLIFELSQNDVDLITNIRNLFPSLLKNIWMDRGTSRLSFSGKSARLQLINYLNLNPLKSHKRIVVLKWIKADRILQEKGLDWKPKIKKLSENLNKWRIKDRVRSFLKEEASINPIGRIVTTMNYNRENVAQSIAN